MKKRSPSYKKTSETKRRIVISAIDQFVSNGFSNTKIIDISTNAGLGKGTIYNYFKTKEELFEGVIDYFIKETFNPIDSNNLKESDHIYDFILKNFNDILESFESKGRKDLTLFLIREYKNFPFLSNIYSKKIYNPTLNEINKLLIIAKERNELKSQIDIEYLSILILAPIWMFIIHNNVLISEYKIQLKKIFIENLNNIFK